MPGAGNCGVVVVGTLPARDISSVLNALASTAFMVLVTFSQSFWIDKAPFLTSQRLRYVAEADVAIMEANKQDMARIASTI